MTNAQNDGTALEQFVAILERSYHPDEFTIETRKRVLDENGSIIAEFDIVISGKVGKTDYTLLIECRDRPSEGSAPASWIEQLVTRKRLYHFNNVIAVSSTGFSKHAQSLARKEAICLRTFSQITPEEARSWIVPKFGPLFICDQRLSGVRVTLGPILAPGTSDTMIYASAEDELTLVYVDTLDPVDVVQLWRSVRFLPLNPDTSTRLDLSNFVALSGTHTFPVEQIAFDISNAVTTHNPSRLDLHEYRDTASERDALAQWSYEVDGKPVRFALVSLNRRTEPKE